jgi:outer membrane protease
VNNRQVFTAENGRILSRLKWKYYNCKIKYKKMNQDLTFTINAS